MIFAVCALGALGLSAAADAGFEAQSLRVPGSVLWVTDGDLDADGRTDVVLSYRRRAGSRVERFWAIFFRGADGFSSRPDLTVKAPRPAAVFDVGPADDVPGDDLVFWTRTGLFKLSFADRRPGKIRSLVATRSLVGGAEKADLPHWRFLRGLGPKKTPTILIPDRNRLRIFRWAKGEWTHVQDVKVGIRSYYDSETDMFRPAEDSGSPSRSYSFRSTRLVPKLRFIDQTGDGREDLVTLFEDHVAVFVAGEDGRFADEPIFRRGFELRTHQELENQDALVSAEVAHLDGDGVADLCLTKGSGGLTSFKSEVFLHRGVAGGGFEPRPRQTFTQKGIGTLVAFEDVDGDGIVEMLQPSAEISVVSMVRALVSKRFDLAVQLRRASEQPGTLFEPKPAQELTMRFELDFSSGATVRGSPPLFGWDFDGDGLRDALLADGGNRMVLHKGQAGHRNFFRKDAHITLDGPSSSTTRPLFPRPDGGLPDVLVFYVAREDRASELLVHRNRYRDGS